MIFVLYIFLFFFFPTVIYIYIYVSFLKITKNSYKNSAYKTLIYVDFSYDNKYNIDIYYLHYFCFGY